MTKENKLPLVAESILEVMGDRGPEDTFELEDIKKIMEVSLAKGASKEDVIELFERFLKYKQGKI